MVFLAGYVLVALANKVSADISGGQIDLGQFSAFQGIILTMIASVVELGRRWMTDYRLVPPFPTYHVNSFYKRRRAPFC